ncbi:hypothetical protein SAMN05216488_1936 [Microbacterium sp. LKL04]|nr:hypothetical protein SAMN05216488_1936 [Microbacterium sp. LKL04]
MVCLLIWDDRTAIAPLFWGAASFALIFSVAYLVRTAKRR